MKHSLARNAAYHLIYQLLNVAFPLISATYLARVLLPSGVGRMDYAQNILSYFVMAAGLGLSAYGTREIAQCRGDRQRTDVVFSELMVLCAAATALCVAGYLCLCRVLFAADLVFHLVVGAELVLSCIRIDWFYQGTESYGYITAGNALVKLLSLAALFLFVKDSGDGLAYAAIHSLSVGCNGCFQLLCARKRVRLTLTGLNIKRHLSPILRLMTGTVAAGLYTRIGVTLLGGIRSVEEVAYYTNADKVTGIALCLVTAVTAVFLPRLSYLYAGEREQFTRCLSDGLALVLLLALPAAVGLVLVAENLMGSLFGAAFLPAAQTLRILAVLTVIRGVGDLLCYQAVVSSGNEGDLILPRVAAGVVSLLAGALLIPRCAHNAAALALVAGELTVNGLLLPRTLSCVRIRLRTDFFRSVAAACAVMAVVVMGVQTWLGMGIFSLCTAVLCGAVSYGAVLLATKNEMLWRGLAQIKKLRGKQENIRVCGKDRRQEEREDIWKR